MITKCMLRAGNSSEVNFASGGSEFSDSSSSVSIGKSIFLSTDLLELWKPVSLGCPYFLKSLNLGSENNITVRNNAKQI